MSQSPKSIMVGVDFSHNSDRALQQALLLAERLGLPLDLCYVGEPPPAIMVPEQLIGRESGSAAAGQQVDYLGFYEQQLSALRAQKVSARVPCRTHLAIGDVATEMLALIDKLQPEMVVVGSHGRGVVLRALLGSVSAELARRSPVPVLVVPTPERSQGGARREGG